MNVLRETRLWTWVSLAASVLICVLLAWLHTEHYAATKHVVEEMNLARQARVDLAQGFLHISLSGEPDSPFDRAEGIALLRQSVNSLFECATNDDHLSKEELARFQKSVQTFERELAKWQEGRQLEAGVLTSLRIGLHDLDIQASVVDRRIQEHLQLLTRTLQRQFTFAITGAILTLALICLMVYLTGRARVRANECLLESEQRWQFALEGAGEGIWDWDAATNKVFYSHQWKSMLGFDDSEIGDTMAEWATRVHPDDEVDVHAAMQANLEGKTSNYVSEHRLRCKDGSYKWILDRGMVIGRDAKGGPSRMIGTHADITSRKEMESTLRRNEERLGLVLAAAHMGVWESDLVSGTVYYSEECRRIMGLHTDASTTEDFLAIVHPEDLERLHNSIEQALSSREAVTVEYRIVRGSNELVWLLDRGQAIFDSEDRPVRLIGAIVDITDRKRAELALRESEQRFRELVEEAPDAIFIQTHGKFAYGNHACASLFGAGHIDELIGSPVLDRFHPDDRDRVRERIRMLNEYRKQAPLADEVILRLDGTAVPVEVSAIPFVHGGENGALVFARDVSERKDSELERERLHLQLLQAQKMESIGRLAGGVAHDFNNMLGVINGYSEMLLDEMPGDSLLRSEVQEIRNAGERAARLTQQLLAFSRKQILVPRVVDLNAVVSEVERMLRRLIGEDIEFKTILAGDLGTVKADPGQLEQVIANLAINARDAMPSGGKLTIETRNIELDEEYANLRDGLLPGPYVGLSVTDSGTGMSAEILSQIFDPFFTTKESGKGTGLGLATAYGTIKQSGGTIWVYSEPGRGTTFKVLLPRVGDIPAPAVNHSALPAPGGTETILLVEDEESVRHMAQRVLSRAGYHVIAAEHAADALALMRKPGQHVHLLLTDMIMPGMNGRELAAALLKSWPDTKVLFMSGYADNSIVANGLLEAGASFINKPFGVNELVQKVRDILGGH